MSIYDSISFKIRDGLVHGLSSVISKQYPKIKPIIQIYNDSKLTNKQRRAKVIDEVKLIYPDLTESAIRMIIELILQQIK